MQKPKKEKSYPITWSRRGIRISIANKNGATHITCIGWKILVIKPALTEVEIQKVVDALDGQSCGIDATQKIIETVLA